MRRVLTAGLLLCLVGCQCGFNPVSECTDAGCLDGGGGGGGGAGGGSAGGSGTGGGGGAACDRGTVNFPHLCLAPNQPAACPAEFPANGSSCSAVATCDYLYPVGLHPSGCEAFCVVGDGGFVWNVPICF